MKNSEIAQLFEEVATLLRISEDNEFHARAYDKAARIVRGAGKSFEQMVHEDVDLADRYRGIGSGIASHIREIINTEGFEKLEILKQKIPSTLIELTKIRGVGPQTARLVWKKANITTVEQLEQAAQANKLRQIKGLGEKTEENILKAIKDYRDWENRFLLSESDEIVSELTSYLKQSSQIDRFEVAGSWRRRKETVGDLDVLVITDHPASVMEYFTDWKEIESVESAGETKSTIVLPKNFRIDFRILAPKNFGAAFLYFTGSKAHNIHVRSRARERNYTISEYGVYEIPEGLTSSESRVKENWVAGKTESEIYELLDLKYIPPELREDRGEIAAAAHQNLPNLIEADQIRGDLQMHTNWTDGNNTIEEMVKECISLGYEYMAITDHSKSMAMTGGLDENHLKKQMKEIDQLNTEYNQITILKGMEVDILKDGTLDLPSSILDDLDLVLASVHTHMDLSISTQTKRILKAIKQSPVNILSHPTGRLINQRNPIDMDFDQIFEVAVDNHVAIECNATPDRLDLDAINLQHSTDYSVKISINTDAHTRGHLNNMKYGINQARRGWIEPQSVINTWNLSKLQDFLKK